MVVPDEIEKEVSIKNNKRQKNISHEQNSECKSLAVSYS